MRFAHFLIVAAAVGAACSRPAEAPRESRRVQRASDITLASDVHVISARVLPGATLASILRAHAVAVQQVEAVVERARAVFDPRRVRRDQPYRLEQLNDGSLRRFEYEIDRDRLLRVTSADGDLTAVVLPIAKVRHLELVRGRIDHGASSLVAAMDAAGETIDLTLALAEIFGGEIDFNTDLQPGDAFQLLVEKQYREGKAFAGYGPVLAAEFDNGGRRLRAVRFTPDGGSPGYFDERGVSMRRFFLKSPLKFDPVITSGFSSNRMHPILHETRAHLGVDYRAPVGAPVVAVSDGVVVSAGMSGGSGLMVHLRHSNGFETEYLHLSSIAVRAGARVHQGDVIGRVGATGLATGPHLDYRVRKNGAFVNPVAAHRAMPPGDPVPEPQMPVFNVARDRALATLDESVATQASQKQTIP